MPNIIIIRGGGDLATGVALRLHRAGLKVVITELPQPLAVRRTVAFSEAIYDGMVTVEDVTARRVKHPAEAFDVVASGSIPVLVDPTAVILKTEQAHILALVDARLIKKPSELGMDAAPLVIGLGPGFTAGENCHAVIETSRGHTMGRVYWRGTAATDTGAPEGDPRRVLRAPADGVLIAHAAIGKHLEERQLIAEVDNGTEPVEARRILAPLKGVLRGIIRPGSNVTKGLKIGDVDPRDDPLFCFLVSDKSLAVGGGVLEAILTHSSLRPYAWS
jgi:xanthine dehydrogenase accessory factor